MMGFFDFNFVGAVVVTFFLLGLLFERPSFVKAEKYLVATPKMAQWALLLFLALCALDEALGTLSGLWPITIPNAAIHWATFFIHEAGHFYLNWTTPVLHSFGGTLAELLFPLVPAAIASAKHCNRLATLFIFWLGHNLFGVAIYISDAVVMKLDLLGSGTHDWNLILGALNLLHRAEFIGAIVWWSGVAVVIISLGLYGQMLLSPKPEESKQLQAF